MGIYFVERFGESNQKKKNLESEICKLSVPDLSDLRGISGLV